MFSLRHIIAAILVISWASTLWASGLILATATEGSTYAAVGNDLSHLAVKQGVALTTMNSSGSLHNLRILKQNEAQLAIVQSDIVSFLSHYSQPQAKGLLEGLGMITPLYREEVHLIAHRDIRSLDDLTGKRISIGQRGTGHWVTARHILALANNIAPAEIKQDLRPDESLAALLMGELDAVFYVGGAPVPLLRYLGNVAHMGAAYREALDRLHLVPITHEKLSKHYSNVVVAQHTYRWQDMPVNTVAVTALLVGNQAMGSAKKSDCDALKKLARQLASPSRMQLFATPASAVSTASGKNQFHPKWRDIIQPAHHHLPAWPAHACGFSSDI